MSSNATTFDPSTVPLTTRSQWCSAQQNTCGTLCSGSTGTDTCDPTTLDYDCTCSSNSSSPGLQYYTLTVPTFICEVIYSQCVNNSAGDAAAQAQCETTEEADCGHLDPANFVAASSSVTTPSSISSIPLTPPTSSTSASLSSLLSSNLAKTTPQTSSTSSSSTSSLLSSTSSLSSTRPPVLLTSSSTSSAISPTPTISPSTNSSGLSTGAKAGIGVGAFFIFLLICLLIWVGINLQRLLRQRQGRSNDPPDAIPPNIAELGTNSRKWPWGRAAELPGTKFWPFGTKVPVEMHAEQRAELDGAPKNRVAELHAEIP